MEKIEANRREPPQNAIGYLKLANFLPDVNQA